jgi:hypothetical protein
LAGSASGEASGENRFQVLSVFLILAHDRRRLVHFNMKAHPTADWTAQQLEEAFPFGASVWIM